MNANKKIYIIAGEESGDFLGSSLIKALKTQRKDLDFIGIGGTKMKKEGISSLFPMHEISFMGLFEILPHIFKVKKRIEQTVQHILNEKPDVIVTIDAQGFCKNIIKKVKEKQANITAIHYVAPQVWAWKPHRTKEYAKIFDKLLCILPFEPALFEKDGLESHFVGHPIIDKFSHYQKNKSLKENFTDGGHVITLLPGSRKQEIYQHMPILKAFADRVKANEPKTFLYIPTIPHMHKYVQAEAKKNNFEIFITADEEKKQTLFQATDFACAATGTVTLELALMKIPMTSFYKMNFFTRCIAKMVTKLQYLNLVNVIFQFMSDKRFTMPIVAEQAFHVKADTLYAYYQTLINAQHPEHIAQMKAFDILQTHYLRNNNTPPADLAAKHVLNSL